MAYPRMIKIRQQFKTNPIKDIPGTVHAELARLRLEETISPGSSVAITAGSRGVANIAMVISAVVNELKEIGAKYRDVSVLEGGAPPSIRELSGSDEKPAEERGEE